MVKVVSKKYVLNSEGHVECTCVETEHFDVDSGEALALIAEVNTRMCTDEQIETDNDNNVVFMRVSYATWC